MYDELVKRLRRCEQFQCRECEYEQVMRCRAKLNAEAVDAIEELSMVCDNLNFLNKHPWIPVTERLPESGVCVLVTDGLEVGEGWITEIINTKGHFSRWCCPTADIDVDRRPITHWMPLPQPPKEE